MAWIPLVAGLAAAAMLLATIGALLYLAFLSVESDRHSPLDD